MVKVQVKWTKNTYDVDVDPAAGLEPLQANLFSLTNVPAARQKLMNKGKLLKDDKEVALLKDGAKLVLMGTADTGEPIDKTVNVVFEEDLSNEEKAKMDGLVTAVKVGLENLGNTCYMNSTLEALRFVPELKTALQEYAAKPPAGQANNLEVKLVQNLGLLYKSLDAADKPVPPALFTRAMHAAFPNFAQRTPQGHLMQQDAEECLSQLLSVISRQVKVPGAQENKDAPNIVDKLFGGEMQVSTKCLESDEEQQAVEHFTKLRCHIDLEINFLHDGVLKALKEPLEKMSPALQRNAKWLKTSGVSSLPPYLIVQFVRFYWRGDTNKKAKILRPVEFPMRLDVEPYCAPALRQSISAKRAKQLQEEAVKLGLEKKKPEKKEADKKDGEKERDGAAPMEVVEDKKELPAVPVDGVGYYELIGVVTHQGREADAGHYVAWIKHSEEEWVKFDDDVVTPVSATEIKKLTGGGDWHMAYICLYRKLTDADVAAEEAAKDAKRAKRIV